MKITVRRLSTATLTALASAATIVLAQQQGTLTPAERQHRIDTENELQSIAVV